MLSSVAIIHTSKILRNLINDICNQWLSEDLKRNSLANKLTINEKLIIQYSWNDHYLHKVCLLQRMTSLESLCSHNLYNFKCLGAPSKLNNGKKHDVVQKGGRGLGQNPSLRSSRKNDTSKRRAVMYLHFFILLDCEKVLIF